MCKITKEAISMKVKFNFNLEAWIQDVEIEADSMEEAENKLYGMTVQELIEAGYVHTSDLDDVEGEIVEQDYKVKVYNIEFDPEDILEYGMDKDLPEKDAVLEFTFKDIKTDREYDELHGYIDDELFSSYVVVALSVFNCAKILSDVSGKYGFK